MNTEDARVKKTRERIEQAFLELATEQGYMNVAVRDIAKEAKVQPSTFYRHYKDKEDLMLKLGFENMKKVLPLMKPATSLANLRQNLLYFFEVMQKRPDFTLIFMSSPVFEMRYKQLVGDSISQGELTKTLKPKYQAIPPEAISYAVMGGVSQLVKWWLENNTPCSPEEFLGYIDRLILDNIWLNEDDKEK